MLMLFFEYGFALFTIMLAILFKFDLLKIKSAILLVLTLLYAKILYEFWLFSQSHENIIDFIYTPQFLISMCVIILGSVRNSIYNKKHFVFLVFVSLMYAIFFTIIKNEYFILKFIGTILLLILNYYLVKNEIFIEHEKNIKNILKPEIFKIFVCFIIFMTILINGLPNLYMDIKINDLVFQKYDDLSKIMSILILLFSTIFTFLLPYGALKKQKVPYSKVCLLYKYSFYVLIIYFSLYSIIFEVIPINEMGIKNIIYLIGFGTMIYGSACLLFVNNINLIVRYAGGSYIGLIFVIFGTNGLLEHNEIMDFLIFYVLSYTAFIYYFMTFSVNGVEINSINSFRKIGYSNFYYSLLIVFVIGVFLGLFPVETMFLKFKIIENLTISGMSEYSFVFYINFCITLYAMLKIMYKMYSYNTKDTIKYNFVTKVSENTAKVRFISLITIVIFMISIHG